MASYDLCFAHKLGAGEACRRVEIELQKLAAEYGLATQHPAENQYRLFGKGVDARVNVTETEVRIGLDMSLFVDMLSGGRIRKDLQDGLPGVLV